MKRLEAQVQFALQISEARFAAKRVKDGQRRQDQETVPLLIGRRCSQDRSRVPVDIPMASLYSAPTVRANPKKLRPQGERGSSLAASCIRGPHTGLYPPPELWRNRTATAAIGL
jgi:hypothetical protein